MTSMREVLPQAAAEPNLPPTLQDFAKQRFEGLTSIARPSRKTEAWKYSAKRLNKLEGLQLTGNAGEENAPADLLLGNVQSHQLVLSNGHLPSSLPQIEGVSIKAFSALSEAEAQQVAKGLIATRDDLPFAEINHAGLGEGLYIEVAKNTQLELPIHLLLVHQGEGMSLPRIFVHLQTGSSLSVIESICAVNVSSEQSLCNQVSDFLIEDNAALTYYRVNDDRDQLPQVAATGAQLKRNARFFSHVLSLGCPLGRHDLQVQLLGSGAECDLNGVCVAQDRQHYDHHTCIEHIASHCNSNENYRCIADDKAQIVFNGRIHIHPDAQKTLGEMSNKNLLLSSEAEIDSKPELEIYADDVKCAHGTTIGQLNEKEVYYLKTRGIRNEQARQMLTLGFVLEIVRAAPIAELAERWEQRLSELLSFED